MGVDSSSSPPASFGKYEIVEQIGEGGFGVVFKGYDPFLKRHVAIKACTSPDEELRQRFFREAEISAQLDHPNIVRVFDFGFEQETPYLVQEYLNGEDLDRKIRKRSFLPPAERLLYLMHIARGLQYAHSQGVIHRDVKPANIRILEDGTAKIMDFGVATLEHLDTRLTEAGMTVGTAAYLAPEQIRGEQPDARTDIFSFGVLAYELIAEEPPFGRETISATLFEILNDDPRPITLPASVCPEALRYLIYCCLEKEPDKRFADCKEILITLDSIRDSLRRQRQDRQLTGALRQVSPTVRPQPQNPAPKRDRFDPVIQHEWTPPSIELPQASGGRRLRRLALLLFLTAAAGYCWLGWQGKAPLPAAIVPTSAAAASETSGSVSPKQAVVNLATQQAPVEASPETAESPESNITVPEPEPEAELPSPAPAEPEEAETEEADLEETDKLEGTEPEKARPAEVQPATAAALTPAVQPDPGAQRRVRNPIRPPGHLTVQASLGSPQGLVSIDGEIIGSSPLRRYPLRPGPHSLIVLPLEGPRAALASTSFQIRSEQETVVTFDLTGRHDLSVRARPTQP
jgi:serine/threonine protein kinase